MVYSLRFLSSKCSFFYNPNVFVFCIIHNLYTGVLKLKKKQFRRPKVNQLDARSFWFTISLFSCLYMFRAHVFIINRSKLHYTASGIITATGGRIVHETATYSV